MARSTPRSRIDHQKVAAQARSERGVWQLAGVYPYTKGGESAAHRIARAERGTVAYAPPGTFEAYTAPHENGGTAVWVRYVAGAPKPIPRPPAMTYRVCDRGSGREYVGVRIVTVTVAADCPRCGCPRGQARSHRFCEDGDWYDVDQWTNRCGHIDKYAAVLDEYRAQMRLIEEAQEKAAVWIGLDAGEYTEAVALLNATAGHVPGLHARRGALFLAARGHDEAARRVMEELPGRAGRMSARQAAVFLTELAAARAACTACDGGLVNYRGRDGEFVSLRCAVCRREVTPVA